MYPPHSHCSFNILELIVTLLVMKNTLVHSPYADSVTHHDPLYHAARRRRVRKGTKSCWECKRRKMKCILDPLTNSPVCNGCRRRGSKCVSQAMSENDPSSTSASTMSDVGGDGRRTDADGILTPASRVIVSSSVQAHHRLEPSDLYNLRLPAHTQASQHHHHESLSRYLHSSLPSQADMSKICYAHRNPSVPILAHEILTLPYTILQQKGFKTPESLLETPVPNSHPVLIAKHMLQIAIFLQHVHPRNENLEGLTESPRAIQERLASLVINLVTTNDELTGSIEGLICVMLESMYQVNVGNLRKGWVAGRRAIVIAQLMGIHRSDRHVRYKTLDPQTEHDAQFMWYRVIFLDRHLSLMLGLPHGSPDHSVVSEQGLEMDTSTGQLERIQSDVASRIIERNALSRASGYFDRPQLELTVALDAELQKAASSLSSKWWRAPNLDNVTSASSEALFWDTRRLFAQVLHYNLINQLHLPYMLRSSSKTRQQRHDYARMTCANASREIVLRFNTLRGFNQIAYSWSCRIVDFLALMAAMTLLLAHLDSHGDPASQDVLANQYLTDRAAIEQVQEHMEEVNRLNSDVLSAQSVHVLRRLLAIRISSAGSRLNFARLVTVHEPENEAVPHPNTDEDDGTVVSAHIPYFGVFKIWDFPSVDAVADDRLTLQSLVEENESPAVLAEADSGYPTTDIAAPSNVISGDTSNGTGKETGTEASIWQYYNDILTEQPQEYPDIAAGGEEWDFQALDMTFLDSLAGDFIANEGT